MVLGHCNQPQLIFNMCALLFTGTHTQHMAQYRHAASQGHLHLHGMNSKTGGQCQIIDTSYPCRHSSCFQVCVLRDLLATWLVGACNLSQMHLILLRCGGGFHLEWNWVDMVPKIVFINKQFFCCGDFSLWVLSKCHVNNKCPTHTYLPLLDLS